MPFCLELGVHRIDRGFVQCDGHPRLNVGHEHVVDVLRQIVLILAFQQTARAGELGIGDIGGDNHIKLQERHGICATYNRCIALGGKCEGLNQKRGGRIGEELGPCEATFDARCNLKRGKDTAFSELGCECISFALKGVQKTQAALVFNDLCTNRGKRLFGSGLFCVKAQGNQAAVVQLDDFGEVL